MTIKRQLGVGDEQQHQTAYKHQRVTQRDRDGGPDHRLQQGGVRGDPRLNLGRLIRVEETRVKSNEVAEHGQPDVRADPLAHPGDEVEAHEGADGEQQS